MPPHRAMPLLCTVLYRIALYRLLGLALALAYALALPFALAVWLHSFSCTGVRHHGVLCALLPSLFPSPSHLFYNFPSPLPQKKKRIIDEPTAKKIQLKLKAACIGSTPQKVFSRYDKDRGGTLDAAEFKRMVRVGMKVCFSIVIISTPPDPISNTKMTTSQHPPAYLPYTGE